MSHHLSDLVAVVTGASSGIGKATALRFAENGAQLVLAGRREVSLRQLADECRELGVRAIPVVTDVTDESQVTELCRRAVTEFGRVDVWVNNAGVMLYGRVQDVPSHAMRRVFIGFADCLRQEIMLDKMDVDVCTVMPASIDTPLFQHAANYSGQEPQPIRPVHDAGEVAGAIIGCVEKPQREVYVGSMGRLTALDSQAPYVPCVPGVWDGAVDSVA